MYQSYVTPLIIYLLVLFAIAQNVSTEKESEARFFTGTDIMDKFREGWEAAGRIVGVDTSQGVASLVSSSLTAKEDEAESSGIFNGFFRLLGFDSKKLGAIAINAVIFLAQLIGNSLIKKSPVDSSRKEAEEEMEGTPLSWVLMNSGEQGKHLIEAAQQRSLPDSVIESLKYSSDSTDCIQLLICKSSPFVWGMQRALSKILGKTKEDPQIWNSLTPLQRMYRDLPSVKEFQENSDACELRFSQCRDMFN